MSKHKILVTGAGGYIGSVATYLLLQNGYKVVALDNYNTGYRDPLSLMQKKFGKDKLSIYELDLKNDLSSLFDNEVNIEAVLHYAAHCLVDESVKDPAKYFSNNICGTENLLSSLFKNNIDKIVFSSTCAVYGNALYVPVDEKHPTNPDSPYGESKRIVERILEWYGKLKGLNSVILRYFNVCGATDDGLIGDSKRPSVLLVQNAVRGALGLEPFYITSPVVNTPDKTPIRDYVNVIDLNEAHILALEYLFKGGTSEIINIGTGAGNSVLEIVKIVQKVTGVHFELPRTSPRLGESEKLIASIDKAKAILSWEPKRSIEDSIRSLVSWYKLHPKGWKE